MTKCAAKRQIENMATKKAGQFMSNLMESPPVEFNKQVYAQNHGAYESDLCQNYRRNDP